MDEHMMKTLRDAELDAMRHWYALTEGEYDRLLANIELALKSLASKPSDVVVDCPRMASGPLTDRDHVSRNLQSLCSTARKLMAKFVDAPGPQIAGDSEPQPKKERVVTVDPYYASLSSPLQQLISEAQQWAASLAMNQSNQDTTSGDLSLTTTEGILARLPDALSKIKYAKLLASRAVPYIGRANGTLEEALGRIASRECYVLFFDEASDSRAVNAMHLFNDLFLRSVPSIFVDRNLSGADYPVPAGQRLVRYIGGRVFDNSYARIPPSGVLRVITKDWAVQEIAAAMVFRTDPEKTRRRLNAAVLKALGERMLWQGKKTDNGSAVKLADITDTKRSLALIDRANAQAVMGLFSCSCRLTYLLQERACVLSWSVGTGTRQVRSSAAALMDMILLYKHFYRTWQAPLNVELLEIDFKMLCTCNKRFFRDVELEFRKVARSLFQECIVGLFATAGRELSIEIDGKIPWLNKNALMQERKPSNVRVLKLHQSRVSGDDQDLSNCRKLEEVLHYATKNCPRLEEVYMTVKRMYKPARPWLRMNDATRAGFASRSLKSTEAVFDFFANHISELNAPFTVYVTIVTETPELPTSGIDHYAWGTLGDGCVMLERSEVFERGGLGASIRKK